MRDSQIEDWKRIQRDKKAHRCVDAFALMRYTCKKCGHSEVFWNSRDGVTPFVVGCPKCGGDMPHVNWNEDRYAPDHVPEPGQGVWVDMPESLKRPLAAAQVAAGDGTEFELQGEKRKQMIEAVAAGFEECEPWLIRWPGTTPEQEEMDTI